MLVVTKSYCFSCKVQDVLEADNAFYTPHFTFVCKWQLSGNRRDLTFTPVTSHPQLQASHLSPSPALNTTASPGVVSSQVALRFETLLCCVLLEAGAHFLDSRGGCCGNEKSEWWSLFSPVFIWSRSESIQKEFSSTERDLELCLKNDFSPSHSGRGGSLKSWLFWLERTGVSFVHYDTSADGSRKCLVPNGILYWIQFMCVSVCSGDL